METNSQRVAYGQTLVELGKDNQDIVVLEADLSKSTMGALFEEAYPDRFFEVGIAEANMASIAAGCALTGKIPFIASFAVFTTGRCYDQIRTGICIPKLNVKICGSSAGLSDFGDGSTHQSVDDISLMRVLPNMQVFLPVDAVQTAQIVRYMAQNPGPMYLRVNRNDLPILTKEDEPFVCGKAYVIRDGSDAVLFANGIMVSLALKAAEQLEERGISLKVVNLPTIKTINEEEILAICKGMDFVITAEEHSVIGGMGSAISDILVQKMPMRMSKIGISDCFGTSAEDYGTLLEHYGLTTQRIVDETIRMHG